MVKKANQRAALIHRSFLSKNTNNLIRAFKTYVRPLLEYASSVWNPSQINLINNSIESVQKILLNVYPAYLIIHMQIDSKF